MPADIKVEVTGWEETQEKMEQVVRDLQGPPFVEAMKSATMIVHRDAKINAPVDTGRLRASILPEVRAHGRVVQGVVGSNLVYAPFQELGTRPFWPPIAALEVWARRHGVEAYLVARAIARRGIRARRYLQRALEDNRQKVVDLIGKFVGKVVAR